MSYNSEEYKQQIYKRWIESGRPWFDIDKTKEPTYAERQIILEMKKRENTRANSDLELEKRPRPKNEIKEFHRLFEVDNY